MRRASTRSTSRRCAFAWAAAWPCSARWRTRGRRHGRHDRAGLRPDGSLADRHAATRLHLNEFNGSVGLPFPSTDVAIFDEDGRSSAPARSARSARAARRSWPAIGSAPTRRRKSCSATAGCARATSGGSTRAAISSSRTARRTSSSSRGSRSIRTRSRTSRCASPACAKRPRSACRDAQSGEVVKLFVVRKDPTLTAAAVLAHARHNLTGYKVPRHVEFVDELPKSNVGKVLRRALKERASSQASASPPK